MFDEFGSFGLLVLQLGFDEVNTAVQACNIKVGLCIGVHSYSLNQSAAEVIYGNHADGFVAADRQLARCRVRVNSDVSGGDGVIADAHKIIGVLRSHCSVSRENDIVNPSAIAARI